MILYLDTSALVKLYVREVGSVRVWPLLDDQRLQGLARWLDQIIGIVARLVKPTRPVIFLCKSR